jgi:Fe(II)/alpha-ketoglutarate-dependent arginine beta-hydroxylase
MQETKRGICVDSTAVALPNYVVKAPVLCRHDVLRTKVILNEVASTFQNVQSVELLEAAPLIAQDLPHALREFLHGARVNETGAVWIVPAADIIGHTTAPTPRDWKDVVSPTPTHVTEVFLVLMASLLGDVFGWVTQQNGRYVHDVLPMKGLEHEQVGWSSTAPLTWHTEDAFHPQRADYLALLCLRNRDRVATTIWSVADLEIDPDVRAVLRQERYVIVPDNSHLRRFNTTDASAFAHVDEMFRNPALVSVLFGMEERPYLRIDPDYMSPVAGDEEAALALRTISKIIDRNIHELVLCEGDLCILDNYHVVHGRRPFRARFDGSDRWLKRTNVMRDLRKAVDFRRAGTRLLF